MPTPCLDLELGDPPPEIQEYARQNCGEDPNTKLQAVYELRNLIYERGECNPHRMDDAYLIRFLRARNFIPQRAHRLIVNYYQFREDNNELFENIFPFDLSPIGDAHVIGVPPYCDQNGRRLLFYRLGCWDPKVIPMEDLFKATVMCLELAQLEPRTQILGGVALFDLEDLGTQHVWQVTPSVAAKIIKLLVTSFPNNTESLHFINHSWIFDKIYKIFKPLLNAKMRSRIFFHGHDVKSLHKHIAPAHLPERYGGVWPDYSYTIWLDSLKKNYTVAKEMINAGYKFREHEICPNIVKQLKDDGVVFG